MRVARADKKISIPFRGIGETGLQKEIQENSIGDGVERAVALIDAAGHAPGFHPVLRQEHPQLHHLPLLREPGLFLLQ